MTTFITALAILIGLLIGGAIALRAWMSAGDKARAEIDALPDVPGHLKPAIIDCMDQAEDADKATWPYDLTAPIVMLVALAFTKRDADRLPRLFRKWDNNVSLNGDGHGWRDAEGNWHHGRDGAVPPPGTIMLSYSDPAYAGDAYYAEGHHPRSYWARYIWVGLRNRASQLSVDKGRDVAARPICISGSADISRTRPGHFLLKQGDTYHYKSFRNIGPFCLIRSYGYKLEYALHRPEGQYGRVPAVAIGRSLKGKK